MKAPNLEHEDELHRNDLVCGIGRSTIPNVGLLFVVKDPGNWPLDKASGKKGGPLGQIMITILCAPENPVRLIGVEGAAADLLVRIRAEPGYESADWFLNGNRLRKVGNWNDE